MSVFLWITAVSLVEYAGDSSLKGYARSGRLPQLALGVGAYGLVVALVVRILRSTNVMYMNGMWDGVSALIESALAMVLLHETLNGAHQYAGLALIVGGIAMMSIGRAPR